jgi:hypothetical protein
MSAGFACLGEINITAEGDNQTVVSLNYGETELIRGMND